MPSVRKTFKYKLQPTLKQGAVMLRTVGLCNWLYNSALEQRRTAWKYHRVAVSQYTQSTELPGIKEAFPEFKDVHAHVLQDVLARVERSFQNMFRCMKNGEKAGYPRFEGSNRYHSFMFKEYGNGARFDNGQLVLSKIGRVKVVWSRPIEGTPKTVTISHEADGWYACISCQDVETGELPKTGSEIGIDVGLSAFYTDSEGEKVENPRYYRKAEKQLKKAHQKVSRHKKGSKRRKKAVHNLKVAYQKVARQREDFHHKEARKLILAHDVIYHEDLEIANMVKNKHLSKSIHDAGWGQFLSILSFKAASAGREVIAVSPAYTTQDCSNVVNGEHCGERVKKSLSMRTHLCPKCGYIADRDHNAAGEIKWRGQRLREVLGVPRVEPPFGEHNRESAGL